jgi:hypothetical protein
MALISGVSSDPSASQCGEAAPSRYQDVELFAASDRVATTRGSTKYLKVYVKTEGLAISCPRWMSFTPHHPFPSPNQTLVESDVKVAMVSEDDLIHARTSVVETNRKDENDFLC